MMVHYFGCISFDFKRNNFTVLFQVLLKKRRQFVERNLIHPVV